MTGGGLYSILTPVFNPDHITRYYEQPVHMLVWIRHRSPPGRAQCIRHIYHRLRVRLPDVGPVTGFAYLDAGQPTTGADCSAMVITSLAKAAAVATGRYG